MSDFPKVIDELESMKYSAEMDGEIEFVNELERAIEVLINHE